MNIRVNLFDYLFGKTIQEQNQFQLMGPNPPKYSFIVPNQPFLLQSEKIEV
jgi:hypothetical protein